MDLSLLIDQWSGKLPEGFVRPAILETDLPVCKHKGNDMRDSTKG